MCMCAGPCCNTCLSCSLQQRSSICHIATVKPHCHTAATMPATVAGTVTGSLDSPLAPGRELGEALAYLLFQTSYFQTCLRNNKSGDNPFGLAAHRAAMLSSLSSLPQTAPGGWDTAGALRCSQPPSTWCWPTVAPLLGCSPPYFSLLERR